MAFCTNGFERSSKSCSLTFPSQSVQGTPCWEHFWKLRCGKVHAVVARRSFRSQQCKKLTGTEHFRCGFAWQAQILHHEGFVAVSKNRWQAWDMWRGSAKMHYAWQAQYKRHVHQRLAGQGGDFLRGVAFWCIRSSGLLRWCCVTGAALRMTCLHFLRGRRSTLSRWAGKNAKWWVRGRQLCSKLSIFEGSLAQLLRFWCCQVQKLRTCRRMASFSSWQIDR